MASKVRCTPVKCRAVGKVKEERQWNLSYLHSLLRLHMWIFMNAKISLTYLLHYLSYSYSVEANLLEQQQAPAVTWPKPAGCKNCFEKTYANSQEILRRAGSKIKGTGLRWENRYKCQNITASSLTATQPSSHNQLKVQQVVLMDPPHYEK